MNGGIPDRDIDALGAYWAVFPSLRHELFEGNGRAGYSETRVESQDLKATVRGHGEFDSYAESVSAIFNAWRETHKGLLWGLEVSARPKTVIDTLSEDLLTRFVDLPLIGAYDVYQRLMDYWDEVMQDDVYLIAGDGWIKAAQPRGIIVDKERKIQETPDLTIKRSKFKMDLVPPEFIVTLYFTTEHAAIDSLGLTWEIVSNELEEFVEEHMGEGGLLEDALNDKGKVTKAGVKAQLRAIQDDDEPESEEERDALTRCLALIDTESKASNAVRDAQAALGQLVLSSYAALTETEIKTLVVEDKWFTSIWTAVEGEGAAPDSAARRARRGTGRTLCPSAT